MALLVRRSQHVVALTAARAMSTTPAFPKVDSTLVNEYDFCYYSLFRKWSGVKSRQTVPQSRLLMGPGPSNVPPRVLSALSEPTIGHLHPETVAIMNELQTLLRYSFQTKNPWTWAVSGPGVTAMQSSLVSLLRPGQKILLVANGYWTMHRVSDMAKRMNLEVCYVFPDGSTERDDSKFAGYYGKSVPVPAIQSAIEKFKPNAVFAVHGESSAGVLQPLEGIGEACHQYNAQFIVDAVCSLGGVPLMVDDWKIDACYSGAQKCLSVPPGISPITFSTRAVDHMQSLGENKHGLSHALDATLLAKYWLPDAKGARVYHHTGCSNLIVALREGLRMVAEESLEGVWARHYGMANHFYNFLDKKGLELVVSDEKDRLPTVTNIKVPGGVDPVAVLQHMMREYNVEMAGGLGPEMAGRIWRVGIMGYNARRSSVALLETAMTDALASQGYKC